MGFSDSHVRQALAVSANTNIQKLVDWLMENPQNSTPDNNDQQPRSMAPPSTPSISGDFDPFSALDDEPEAFEPRQSLPPAPGMDQSLGDDESLHYLRAVLRQDLENGIPLTVEQNNFLLLDEHTPGAKYECSICYDDELDIHEIFVLGCQHFNCLTCMEHHILAQCGDMKASDIKCPSGQDCEHRLQPEEVKKCLANNPEQYDRYQTLLLNDALKKDPECRWCPKPGCNTAMLGNPGIPMMRCPKKTCAFAFCFNCKEAWHNDLTCEQFQQWKQDNSASSSRFEVWAQQNTKKCPKCHVAIQKAGGCNHMTCTNCRHEYCWLCNGSVLGPDGKYKSGHWALDESSPCYNRMHS